MVKVSLSRMKPAADKRWLHLLAGITWSGVGILLITFAIGWWQLVPLWPLAPLAMAGLLAAAVIWRYGFSRLADKNITRIDTLPEKPCLFAFQKWSSFLIIPVMIAMGIALRHSPLPKPILAILYTGIGGGLLLSSLSYYIHLIKARPQSH